MSAIHLPDLRQGDDYSIEIKYPAGTDITGFRFYFTLKNSFDELDADAVLQYSTTAGSGTLDTPLLGSCVMTVPAASTASVAPGGYFYDLQAADNGGHVVTLVPPLSDYNHKLVVIPQVTRVAI